MNSMGESNGEHRRRNRGDRAGVPRRAVGDACTAEILKALVDGPRASGSMPPRSPFVAGVSGELGPDSRLSSRGAHKLGRSRRGERQGGVQPSAPCSRACTRAGSTGRVVYGLLTKLVSALDELDAALMLSLLRCGARLRSEDPAGMRDFIASLQTRVAELREKSKEGDEDGDEDGDGRAAGSETRRAHARRWSTSRTISASAAGAGAGGAGRRSVGLPAALASGSARRTPSAPPRWRCRR